jgi:hypothetical protein
MDLRRQSGHVYAEGQSNIRMRIEPESYYVGSHMTVHTHTHVSVAQGALCQLAVHARCVYFTARF